MEEHRLPGEDFFGIPLSTHRDKRLGPDALSYFQYEPFIAGASIFFFRAIIYSHKEEPASLRYFFACLLAFLAYSKRSYELISAVEILSYAVPLLLKAKIGSPDKTRPDSKVLRLLAIAASACLSFLLSHCCATGHLLRLLTVVTPTFIKDGIRYLIPVTEMEAAYEIMAAFTDPLVLNKQLAHLFFVTFHIQVGMGYLGIDFLTKEQHRRNELIRLDMNDTKVENNCDQKVDTLKMEKAKSFQRSAAPFIFFTAVPYMVRIIAMGNVNKFAFSCVQHELHRAVRLNELFDHDNRLVAISNDSAMSPKAYAGNMDNVVSTAYDLFNRKLFSLPKVLLLPGIMSRQPVLLAEIAPFIFASDWAKGKFMAYMTTKIEEYQKDIQAKTAIRDKVEAFDMKNAELLQRSGDGAIRFTQRRWEELTVEIQEKYIASDLMVRTKGFFGWIQRSFVFGVLVDCALAHLIAVGKIVAADIFVFSRAIEDTVDMALMKSRSEAELARMMTDIEKLQVLADVYEQSAARTLLPCNLAPPTNTGDGIVIRNLHYSRGTASIRADHVEIPPGVYALTGSNGSGKSTLFRVFMSCSTNDKGIDLPSSILLSTPMEPLVETDDIFRETSCVDKDADEDMAELLQPEIHMPRLSITMPSSHVVEISQSFYWPLYSKPIDWIYGEHVTETTDEEELERRVRLVAEELQSLEFVKNAPPEEEPDPDSASCSPSEDAIVQIMKELQDTKDDWFDDLSGGQRSKVELVRKVFLLDECPRVLLIDETMAPLDPTSKSQVMGRLKSFCSKSVVIVIYHTDVGQGQEDTEGELVECVPSNNFFDNNIHLENQMIHFRPVC